MKKTIFLSTLFALAAAFIFAGCDHPCKHTDLQEISKTAATCTSDGNEEYYFCKDCSKYFSDAECKNEISENSWIIPAKGHSPVEHAAAEATCTSDGNVLYYTCSECNKTFSDAECKNEITDYVVPAKGHTMVTYEAKAATCTEQGNSAYYGCSVCGKYFSDAKGQTEIAKDSWIIPAKGHSPVEHTAVEATCTEAGNTAYYSCSVCHKYFSDAEGKNQIAENSWIIAPKGHTIVEHAAVAKTCDTCGNSLYYECSTCHKYFSDAAGQTEIVKDSWVIPADGHTLVDHAAQAATCTEAGWAAYKECSVCGYTTKQTIAALGHDLTMTDAVNATCEKTGNSAYYSCSRCNEYFSDEDGEHEIAKDSWVIAARGHTLTKTDAVEATCTEAGNTAYYSCSVCHKYFSDAEGKNQIAENSWTVAVLAHSPQEHSSVEATCEATGNSLYYECSVCHKYFSDVNCTTEIAKDSWVIAAKGHTLTKIDAVSATCEEAGNSAYYECSVCHKYFSDANGEKEIAKDSWVIAATGHKMVLHLAEEATCEEAGNTQYFECSVCHQGFSDMEATDKLVKDSWIIAPTGHNLTEHKAVAATCTEDGNELYYSCDKCGKDYKDAEAANLWADKEDGTKGWFIAKLGHDLIQHDGKPATATASGYEAYETCSRCDYSTYADIPVVFTVDSYDEFADAVSSIYTNKIEVSKIILASDIDGSGKTWTVSDTDEFSGELDGQGYSLKNFTLDNSSVGTATNIGIFPVLGEGASIHDVTFDSVKVTLSYAAGSSSSTDTMYIGTVAGKINSGNVSINNVTVSNTKIAVENRSDVVHSAYIGGLFGSEMYTDSSDLRKSITVKNLNVSYVENAVTYSIGGLVGLLNGGSGKEIIYDTCSVEGGEITTYVLARGRQSANLASYVGTLKDVISLTFKKCSSTIAITQYDSRIICVAELKAGSPTMVPGYNKVAAVGLYNTTLDNSNNSYAYTMPCSLRYTNADKVQFFGWVGTQMTAEGVYVPDFYFVDNTVLDGTTFASIDSSNESILTSKPYVQQSLELSCGDVLNGYTLPEHSIYYNGVLSDITWMTKDNVSTVTDQDTWNCAISNFAAFNTVYRPYIYKNGSYGNCYYYLAYANAVGGWCLPGNGAEKIGQTIPGVSVTSVDYDDFDTEDHTITLYGFVTCKDNSVSTWFDVIELTITVTPHDLVSYEAKAATCTEDGNNAYVACKNCSYSTRVVIPAEHTLTHAEAKAATCTEAGNLEYYYCSVCKNYFKNAECTETYTVTDGVPECILPANATGHDLTAKTSSCSAVGTYYICNNCGKYFADAEGKTEITLADTGHDLEHHDATVTCTADGMTEYWSCKNCNKYFLDENGTEETSAASLTASALGHDLKEVAAKAATNTEEGYQAYQQCSRCDYHTDITTIAINATITTYDELVACMESYYTNYAGHAITITLANDIDANNAVWLFASNGYNFCGTFDGNGYKISNVLINSSMDATVLDGRSVGFFPNLSGNAIVRNVEFDNLRIELSYTSESKASTLFIGGVVGRLTGSSVVLSDITLQNPVITISNLTSVTHAPYIGGVVGSDAYSSNAEARKNITVNNLQLSLTDNAPTYGLGGYAGYLDAEGNSLTLKSVVISGGRISAHDYAKSMSSAVMGAYIGIIGDGVNLTFDSCSADIEMVQYDSRVNSLSTITTGTPDQTPAAATTYSTVADANASAKVYSPTLTSNFKYTADGTTYLGWIGAQSDGGDFKTLNYISTATLAAETTITNINSTCTSLLITKPYEEKTITVTCEELAKGYNFETTSYYDGTFKTNVTWFKPEYVYSVAYCGNWNCAGNSTLSWGSDDVVYAPITAAISGSFYTISANSGVWSVEANGTKFDPKAAAFGYAVTSTNSTGTYYGFVTGLDNYWYEVIKVNIVMEHSDVRYIAANDASCDAEGNTAYYACMGCGKYFSDAACENEIEEDSWVIAKLPHEMEDVAAVAATDYAKGHEAYQQCKNCSYHTDIVVTTTGKSVVFFGDSVSAGISNSEATKSLPNASAENYAVNPKETAQASANGYSLNGGWAYQYAKNYGGIDVYNYSVSGSTMATSTSGVSNTMSQFTDFVTDYPSVTPTTFVIEVSFNDINGLLKSQVTYNNGAKLSDYDEYAYLGFDKSLESSGLPLTTTIGAQIYLVQKIHEAYPSAQIVLLSAPNRPDLYGKYKASMSMMSTDTKAIADGFGISYVDMYNTDFTLGSLSDVSKYWNDDLIHPTQAAYEDYLYGYLNAVLTA